jgi:hypothetical protein
MRNAKNKLESVKVVGYSLQFIENTLNKSLSEEWFGYSPYLERPKDDI